MTTTSLVKKAIKHIDERSFCVSAYTSSGAPCDCGWDCSEAGYLDLDKAEMLGEIKCALECDSYISDLIDVEELFKGIKTKSADTEEAIAKIAYEAAYPDGGPQGSVKDFVPNELKDLVEEIESLDKDNEDYEENAAAIREKLKDIQSGKYTIIVDVIDSNLYMFAEDHDIKIELSAEKARGILYNYCDNDSISIDSLFDGIDYENTNEDDIQAIVDKMNFDDYADPATGTCDELSNYTNAWCQFIYAILIEKVTEENFDDCLSFFDDTEFTDEYDSDFDNWFDENIGTDE